MLGSSQVKTIYATSSSITTRQKTLAEWNMNVFAKPYIYGVGDGTYAAGGTTLSFSGLSYGANSASRLSFKAKAVGSGAVTIVANAKAGSTFVGSTSTTIYVSTIDQWYDVDFFTFNSAITSTVTAIDFSYYSDDTVGTVSFSNTNLYKISRFDALNRQVCPIESVFSKRMGGEVFVDKHGASYSSTVLPNNLNVCPYNIAYNSVLKEQIGTSDIARNFIPSEYAKFKYLIVDSTVDSSVFAEYENSFKTNKIVIKVNSANALPSSVSLSLKVGGTWTSQTVSSSSFSNDGLLVLYWNGSSWSNSKWASVPKLSAGVLSTSPVTASGIKVTFGGVTAPNNSGATEIHLVEISPRLEIDLSDYVQGFEITKELSNDSLPLPVGVSNSNVATISLSNIPDTVSTNLVFPFTNDSTVDSPMKGIISKGTKFKLSTITVDGATEYEIPAGVFYAYSWQTQYDLSVSVECFDVIKEMSMTQVPIVFEKSVSPQVVVSQVLDSSGFTDYDYSALIASSDTTIPYAWTMRDNSVLTSIQDFLLPYQIAMYADEYGAIRFYSLKSIISQTNTTSQSFGLTYDTSTIGGTQYEPNIINYEEEVENQADVSIGYTNITPKETSISPTGQVLPAYSNIWNAPSEKVGYIKLNKTLLSDAKELSYVKQIEQSPFIQTGTVAPTTPQPGWSDISDIQSFSGYIIIGQEIIGYEGKRFTISDGTNSSSYIINSAEELEYYKNKALATGGTVTIQDLGILCNLKRGMFGTTPATYDISLTSAPISLYSDSATARSASSQAYTQNSYGFGIMPGTGVKQIAFHNSTTTANHRIFSTTLTFNNVEKLPATGEVLRFGLIFGAQTGSADGRCVELAIKRHVVGQDIVIRSALRTYLLSGGTRTEEKVHVLYDQTVNKKTGKVKTTGSKDATLNMIGQNTITAILNTAGDRMSVLINGSLVSWSDPSSTVGIEVTSKGAVSKFVMPSLKITPPTITGRYFGAFNGSSTFVSVNALEAYELLYDDTFPTAETISTVIVGNQFNLSNKNELESIVSGYMVKDQNKSISYIPNTVAREVKIFDFDYQVQPVSWSNLTRTASSIFKTDYLGKGGQNITIPSDALSVSSFVADSARVKFALANAYTEPVFLNVDTSDVSVGSKTTYINGIPLEPKGKQFISMKNNRTFESEVKLDSDWIQDEKTAAQILSLVTPSLIMKKTKISAKIFGNPLIQIGDIVGFSFSQRNIPLKNYVVIGIKLGYNSGITTELTLRRIQP